MKNTATPRPMFKWQSGEGLGNPTAVHKLVGSATRYAERYALEFGFARRSPRLTHRRPRASFFADDRPFSRSNPAWLLRCAFSWSLVLHHWLLPGCCASCLAASLAVRFPSWLLRFVVFVSFRFRFGHRSVLSVARPCGLEGPARLTAVSGSALPGPKLRASCPCESGGPRLRAVATVKR